MKLLTVEELSEKLSLSKKATRELLREGKIEGKKLGKRWYVKDGWLENYFSSRDKQEISDK